MVYIGTSGYSYDDWAGPFYPEGTPKNKFLDYYARHFGVVEVNYSFYTLPNARTLAAMSAKTPPDFRFVIKANREMTHEPGADRVEVFEGFTAALEPLREQGKFGCVLAQFPHSFKCVRENVRYLREFRELMQDLPVVIEFRNRGWIRDETFGFLREQGFGFCCVDQPQLKGLLPPVAEATSDLGYLRFHGRNYDKWWEHEEAWERYNYLYSKEELGEWVDKFGGLAAQTEQAYVFFNNHYSAQAVQNAMDFAELLGEAGVT